MKKSAGRINKNTNFPMVRKFWIFRDYDNRKIPKINKLKEIYPETYYYIELCQEQRTPLDFSYSSFLSSYIKHVDDRFARDT